MPTQRQFYFYTNEDSFLKLEKPFGILISIVLNLYIYKFIHLYSDMILSFCPQTVCLRIY